MSTTYLSVDYFPLTVNFSTEMPLNWLKPNMASEWMELYANFYVKYSKKDITSHGVRNNR